MKKNIQKGWTKCLGLRGIHSGDSHKPRGACFGAKVYNVEGESDCEAKPLASNLPFYCNLSCDLGQVADSL